MDNPPPSMQKKANGKTVTNEHRYEQMASLTSEGLMIHDNDIVLDANLAFAELVGCSNPEEMIGRHVIEIFPFTAESRQFVLAQLKSGITKRCEVELKKGDGTIAPAEIFCRNITYQNHPAHLISLRDITERKQTETQLTRQLERLNVLHTIDQSIASIMDLRSILKSLAQKIVEQVHVDSCAILLLNSQTQTLDFSVKQGFLTSALEFTHLGLGQGLAGHAAQDQQVVHIPDLSKTKNNPALTRAIANENFTSYLGIPLVAKGNLLGVLEIFHRSPLAADADWMKFMEILANKAAIAIDNARLMSIAQQSFKETHALYHINQRLIATIDPQELMDDVVNLLQTDFGYHFVQIFVADPKTGDVVMRAGSGELGTKLKNEGYRLLAGDGIVGVTAETGKPFFTNNVEDVFAYIRPPYLPDTKSELAVPIRIGSQFLGLLDIHQKTPNNLTERDVQLVTAVADQLAVALQKAALYTELQEALLQEQTARSQLIHNEKLAVAGRLLASVSHELNNPIQAIQNALFLLKEEKGLSQQGRQDLEIVLSETDRMASMLQRLRTTYQPIENLDFKPVDVNAVIQDVGILVATHLRHNRITFEFQPDAALPPVSGIEDQLKQVMLNLVMNSVEAMAEGGSLKIATQYQKNNREALITVCDTGHGIDKNILPFIFDAFVTNKKRGTGLGLTITNEIVLKHGGRIQAENNPQCGATILIWLPVILPGE